MSNMPTSQPTPSNPITHIVPMVVTEQLDAVREFYAALPGAQIDIDMEDYVQVRFALEGYQAPAKGEPGDRRPAMAFLTPASTGVFKKPLPALEGAGLLINVPVTDADAHHDELTTAQFQPTSEAFDKPWGWRSFQLVDPCGVTLDFFHVKADAAALDAAS